MNARFPLHLRPKNRQVLQYTRMAADIVRDLELDQAEDDIDFTETRASSERMDAIRAYLATHLLCSRSALMSPKTQLLQFDNWTATCCEILADPTRSTTSDQTLAWHVRLQHLLTDTVQLSNKRGARDYSEEQRAVLLTKGMEAQFREFQGQISADISAQREDNSHPHQTLPRLD